MIYRCWAPERGQTIEDAVPYYTPKNERSALLLFCERQCRQDAMHACLTDCLLVAVANEAGEVHHYRVSVRMEPVFTAQRVE